MGEYRKPVDFTASLRQFKHSIVALLTTVYGLYLFQIAEQAFRGSRIAMDIEAGAPVILIPHSSRSTDILVMNLGTLTVHNTFRQAGLPGTISHRQNKTKPGESPAEGSTVQDDTFLSCVSSEGVTQRIASQGATGGGSTTYQTAYSGSGATRLETSMTSSVYGSLDEDWRSGELESFSGFESLVDSASTVSIPSSDQTLSVDGQDQQQPTQYPASLSSFFSAVSGGDSSCVSSSIGTANPSERTSSHRQGLPSPDSTSSRIPDYPVLNHSQSDPLCHKCLLDVMDVELYDMDLFSAEWKHRAQCEEGEEEDDLIFPSYVVRREVRF